MRLRLVLAQREDRRVPAVGLQPRRIVDWKPQVVAELGPGNAMLLVLMVSSRPFAREIDLGESGGSDKGQSEGAGELGNWITW